MLVARNSETETMSLHSYKTSHFIHIEINHLIVHYTQFTPKTTFPFNKPSVRPMPILMIIILKDVCNRWRGGRICENPRRARHPAINLYMAIFTEISSSID